MSTSSSPIARDTTPTRPSLRRPAPRRSTWAPWAWLRRPRPWYIWIFVIEIPLGALVGAAYAIYTGYHLNYSWMSHVPFYVAVAYGIGVAFGTGLLAGFLAVVRRTLPGAGHGWFTYATCWAAIAVWAIRPDWHDWLTLPTGAAILLATIVDTRIYLALRGQIKAASKTD